MTFGGDSRPVLVPSVALMPFDLSTFLTELAPHGELVVIAMTLAAALEAAFGIGVVVPGEAVVAAGAAVLAGGPLVTVAWFAVAAGAFAGDQLGYVLGRRYGTAVAESWVGRRLGRARWELASRLIQRRSFWIIVVARLIPGVRTLVSAAAATAGVPWARFAVPDALASATWAGVWVLGGAALGPALLGPAWAVAGVAAVAGLVVVHVRRRTVVRRRPPSSVTANDEGR